MMDTINLALYARLSLEDADIKDNEESNSIVNQRLIIRTFIEKSEEFKRGKVQISEFVDDGYSGTNFDRPGFQRMLYMVRNKQIQGIIVKDFSRLGRDIIDTQNYIENIFPFLDVRFIAINEQFDSNQYKNRSIGIDVKCKNLINGIYPQECSAKAKVSMRNRSLRGQYNGCTAAYGYYFNEQREYIIDEEAANIVKLIFDLTEKGLKTKQIILELNERGIEKPCVYLNRKYDENIREQSGSKMWSRITVRRMLANPVYLGSAVNHKTENLVIGKKNIRSVDKSEWIIVGNKHEAIISEEQFNKVAVLLESRAGKSTNRRKGNKSIFSGKLKCSNCGTALNHKLYPNAGKDYYVCARGKYYEEKNCHIDKIQTTDLMQYILDSINEQTKLITELRASFKKKAGSIQTCRLLTDNLLSCEEQLKRLEERKLEQYEKYRDGRMKREEYIVMKTSTRDEIERVKQAITNMEMKINEIQIGNLTIEHEYVRNMEKYSNIQKLSRDCVQELIEKIVVYDADHIEIEWKNKSDFEALLL